MKRRTLITLLICMSLIVVLWVAARLTNVLQFYRTPSNSNAPAIQQGSIFFASKLKSPERFDFICYKSTVPENEGETWIHRLCGLPGDTIQIKNGSLLINQKQSDTILPLSHDYLVLKKELDHSGVTLLEETGIEYYNDSIIVLLLDSDVRAKKIDAVKYAYPLENNNKFNTKDAQNRTQDNFGPVIVPPDSYFVLGDSRTRSMDSRYTGFIPKANFVGTVLWR